MTRQEQSRLRVGDVVRMPSGTLRTVRRVTHHPVSGKASISLAILHCSWTRRAYTIYNGNDLAQGWTVTGTRRKLRTKLDRELAREITNYGLPTLTCCDVKGAR